MTYGGAVKREYDDLVESVVEVLKKQSNDFQWCPSLKKDNYYTRDALIREVKNKTPVGRQFLKVTMAGTISRLNRPKR